MIAQVTIAATIAVVLAFVAVAGFVLRLFDRARKAEGRMATLEAELRSHLHWHNGREE